MKLNELLNYIEKHIEPQHAEDTERLHIDAMDYKAVPRLPLSLDFPIDQRCIPYTYREAFNNVEVMLYYELALARANILNHIELMDDYPLQVRANYGVGVVSSLFGQICRIVDDNMPWVEHLSGKDSILRLLDLGVPDPDTALGKQVRICLECFRESFSHYPQIEKYVRITQPDMQGPFDILHLMIGNDLFCMLYDDPLLVHNALDLICETYITYRRFIQPYLTDQADNGKKCYVHHGIYAGSVVLKDDTATSMISDKMYREFALPYNERIFKAFGGGSLHFCGARKEWHYPAFLDQSLSCLNFGNSEQQDFMRERHLLTDAKISVVGFGEDLPYDFVSEFIKSGFKTGFTAYAWANTQHEARDILNQHKG